MKFLVVDIETGGFDRGDPIVEVGVVSADTAQDKAEVLIDTVVRDDLATNSLKPSAWIFHNTTLTPTIVKNGPPLSEILIQLDPLLSRPVTAFNMAFDIPFLAARGVQPQLQLPCLMQLMTPICKLPFKKQTRSGQRYKWPKFEEAWAQVFPDKPWYKEAHRAGSDAYHEALLALHLFKEGILRFDDVLSP